ncbi:MAG: hypothetical protein DRP01_02545 [Archaeoglobales archaeon]|nr:MAG: hypothetical protein DRP01_02545 [Archaeoglobales archaeon]
MGLPAPMSQGLLWLLKAEVERRIKERMPGAQVKLEGDRLIIFFPMDEVIKMVRESLPERWRYISEIRSVPGGIEVSVKVR